MFDIKALNMGNGTGEVLVYGDIVDTGWERWSEEDITPKMFNDALSALGNVQNINVRINCYGGSVFAGRAMGVMLQDKKKTGTHITTTVEGVGASMASVLFQYGDDRVMWSGTHLMVHKPLSGTRGNADDHRKTAELLDKIEDALIAAYMQHFTGTEDELRAMVAKETWLEAEEAYAVGLCSDVEGIAEVSAHALGYRFGDLIVPKAYLGDYANKINIPKTDGGEKEMFNKETDAKIKAILDGGKAVAVAKDGDNYVVSEVAEGKPVETETFLTAEQVQESTGVENANPDTVLGMLGLLANSGVTPANADDTLCKLLEKAEKSTTLTAKAAERDVWFETLVDEAIANGVRAEGNDFDKDWWDGILKAQPMAKVKAQSDKWLAKAEQEFDAGSGRRSKVPGTANATQAPDDCFTL